VFSVEFKRDARDGVCRLIEVNARPWWFVEFAGQCGVNFCAMSVGDALGKPVVEVREYRVGRRCVYPYYDYPACSELRREGKLSLAKWFASWAGATQPAFRWSDPVPAVTAATGILAGRLARALGVRRADAHARVG
jgi:predicted ATP-grasp superfamily ATP-dependent carboligase